MKIKQKKQLNLPQLIEYAWDNRATESTYKSESITVSFSISGNPRIESEHTFLPKNETFTVTVEEELTEDTIFKELICLDVDGEYESHDNSCILDFDEDRVRAIYIPNSDLTMTLIWTHEKGLVD